jgi:ribonuclease-3
MTTALQDALGYRFSRPTLLDAALVHRSYTAEHPEVPDNERLEFLGDAVLQLAVTGFLYANYPDLKEGEMAKVRAACVNRAELATIARELDIGSWLRVGVGEQSSGGRTKDSILADAIEAILAAVYLDAGYGAAELVVLTHWEELIHRKAATPGARDYKTRLQEQLAVRGVRPQYEVEDSGPDHAKVFSATVFVEGVSYGSGAGRSKKEAQQRAAQKALEDLE